MPRGNIDHHSASAPLHHLFCLNADPVSHPGLPWASRPFHPSAPFIRIRHDTLDDRGFLSPLLSPPIRIQPGILDDRWVLLPLRLFPNADPAWHTGRPWGFFTAPFPSLHLPQYGSDIPAQITVRVSTPTSSNHHRQGTPEPRGNIQC